MAAGRLGDGGVDERDARLGRLLPPYDRPQAVMQCPPERPGPPERPAPRVGVGRRLLPQLVDFRFTQHPALDGPVEQLAVSANLVVADHLEPVPSDGTDEIEAEDFRQITFNCDV